MVDRSAVTPAQIADFFPDADGSNLTDPSHEREEVIFDGADDAEAA